MTLRRRVVLTALAVSLPPALIVLSTADWIRASDMRLALGRVVTGHLTESVRDQCQADPQWFLAGPRSGRPSLAARQMPDADVLLPRPSVDELPFEIFAYDDQFSPTSTAGPRFPLAFRDVMRTSPPTETVSGEYSSNTGTGIQIAQLTGWSPGPCAVLLFRMQPVPNLGRQRALVFAGSFALVFLAMMVAIHPTIRRVRRMALALGGGARDGYAPVAPEPARDEISSMAFVYNDAAAEIHRRGAENKGRVDALRRHVEETAEGVGAPLAELEARLADAATREGASAGEKAGALAAFQRAHDITMRLENLAAAARLRMDNQPLPRETTDVAAAVAAVVRRHAALASGAGVTLVFHPPARPVTAAISSLFERAIGNLVDNAIRYNRPGGRVDVRVVSRGGDVSVLVTDTGRGVTEELFKGLTAVRRFRGDEARNRRPDAPGLGIAVAREIADRSGLRLELRVPPAGGFEAAVLVKLSAHVVPPSISS
jgi:signal transduction histidine kinase